jgi:transcriptional regulator with XRE-family HTH domain
MPERSFGRVVRFRRTKLGLSQAQLGQLVGRTPATIRSWESDKSVPNDPKLLTTLSAILGVDERTMFDKAGQEPPMVVESSPTIEEALASLSEPGTSAAMVTSNVYQELAPGDGVQPVAEPKSVMVVPPVDVPVEDEDQPDPGDDGDPEWYDDDSPGIVIELESRATGLVSVPVPAVPALPATAEVAVAPAATVESLSPPTERLVVTSPAFPVVEPSYLEDSTQRQMYRVRTLATVVGLVALVVAFLWAMSEGISALGDWWDGFLDTLRL